MEKINNQLKINRLLAVYVKMVVEYPFVQTEIDRLTALKLTVAEAVV